MRHLVPLVIVLAYIGVMFLVTAWSQRLAARHGGGLVGYLLAGRQLPAGVAAALLAGLAVGGASTIGVAEQSYRLGLSAGWYNAAWAAGAAGLGLGAARRFRRLGFTTLPELFGQCYDRTGRILGVAGQLAIQVVITSLQYVAGGAILAALLPEVFTLRTGMAATAVVFVGITLVGGFWAAGLTNVINVALIYVGLLLGGVLSLRQVGGLAALADRLPAGHPGFDLWAVGPAVIAGWFLVMITMAHSTQGVIQIGLACRDERTARRAYLLGALVILPVGFLGALIGLAAAVLHPGIPAAEALPRVVLGLSPWAAGLVLAGLWAADVSTASALLMSSATLVCHDVVRPLLRRPLDEAAERRLCRLTVAAVSAVTFGLALTVTGILQFLLVGLTLSTAYTLVALATLYTPGLCRRSTATATLLATFLALAVWLGLPPRWRLLPHPIYATWIASLVALLVVALVDRRRITPPTGMSC
jgi:SSS family solute:Na+ symporter